MSVIKEDKPKIIAQRNNLRLVHEVRNQERWPGVSDLVLERLHSDAMKEPIWITVDTWCLYPRKMNAVLDGRKADSVIVALNLLLTNFDVLEKE